MIRNILTAFLIICCLCPFQTVLAKVRLQVSVEGVGGDLRQNVLKFLSMEGQKNAPELTGPVMMDLFKRAPGEIRTALEPFGYYTPAVKSELVKKDGAWYARFRIDPGQPVRISKLALQITGEGAGTGPFGKWKETFPLKPGDILDQPAYEKAKRGIQEIAANDGYLNADFTRHEILVYPERHAADIFLSFDTGARYRFGDVTFIQNTLSPGFLQRFVPFEKGDPYSIPVLLRLQNSLANSGYFSQVLVTPMRKEAKGLVIPIEVKLTPAKRYRISLGAGFGTDTGLRGQINWMDRWLNRRGHRMEVDLRLAEIRKNAIWRYIVPLRHPLTNHLDYTAGYLTEDTTIERSQTYLAGVSYTHPRSPRWLETLYFNAEREHFTVAGETASSRLIIPGATWTYKRAPEQLYANQGLRMIADLKGTYKLMFSSVSFIQGRLRSKYIRGIGGFGSVILRGDAGLTEVDNFQRLPASFRFFAGGDNSLRGYSYKSLGPRNSLGLVEGGRYLLVGSIEYVQKVYGNWGAAVFYDGGNAFNALPFQWKSGAGFGVRWASPVGPVRVDFAWGVSEPHPPFHIHINVGPEI